MKVQKRLAVMVLTGALALSLVAAACGQGAAPAPAQQPAAPATSAAPAAKAPEPTKPAAAPAVKEGEFFMKISASNMADEPGPIALSAFGKAVEERSKGRIKFQVYPNNALGNERDVIEGVTLNTIQAVAPSNAPLTAWVPEMNIFELPFIWRDAQHMALVLDGPIGQKFAEPLKAKGLHLLGYHYVGLRHIMTTKKVVNTVDDLKGLKIRTMENPVHLSAFKAFGANPLPMAYGELYTALQQGVIDGAEAANTNYEAKKFYEPAPNWAMVGWLRLVAPFVMSEKFFQSLPKDLQTIVVEEAQKANVYERELYVKGDEVEALEKLKKAGVKITTPDRKPFVEASQKVYEEWAPKVGGRARIDEIMNAK